MGREGAGMGAGGDHNIPKGPIGFGSAHCLAQMGDSASPVLSVAFRRMEHFRGPRMDNGSVQRDGRRQSVVLCELWSTEKR